MIAGADPFEQACKKARREYWRGVAEEQLGIAQEHWRLLHPSYRVGVWHVRSGIVPRHPLSAIHHGWEFIDASQAADCVRIDFATPERAALRILQAITLSALLLCVACSSDVVLGPQDPPVCPAGDTITVISGRDTVRLVCPPR